MHVAQRKAYSIIALLPTLRKEAHICIVTLASIYLSKIKTLSSENQEQSTASI